MENRDREHLSLLSVFHYVYGALILLMSCLPLIYVAMGVFILLSPEMMEQAQQQAQRRGAAQGPPPPPPQMMQMMGGMVVAIGAFGAILCWVWGVLSIVSGRMLAKARGRTFSLVVAAFNCMAVPLGTVLGIFTLIVLLRDSVARLYEQSAKPG